MNPYTDVRDFMTCMGQDRERYPRLPSMDIIKLRNRLDNEEFKELRDGAAYGDLVEILDGILDLMYVIVGEAIAYGLPLEVGWRLVQDANMAKLWTEDQLSDSQSTWTADKVLFVPKKYSILYGTIVTDARLIQQLLSEHSDLKPHVRYVVKENGKVKKPPTWKAPDIRSAIYWHIRSSSNSKPCKLYSWNCPGLPTSLLLPVEYHDPFQLALRLGFRDDMGGADLTKLYEFIIQSELQATGSSPPSLQSGGPQSPPEGITPCVLYPDPNPPQPPEPGRSQNE